MLSLPSLLVRFLQHSSNCRLLYDQRRLKTINLSQFLYQLGASTEQKTYAF